MIILGIINVIIFPFYIWGIFYYKMKNEDNENNKILNKEYESIKKDLDRLEKLEKVIKEVIIRNNASIKFLQLTATTEKEKEEDEKIIAFLDAITKTLKEVLSN